MNEVYLKYIKLKYNKTFFKKLLIIRKAKNLKAIYKKQDIISSRALIMNTANHEDTRNTTAFIPPMILAAARCFHGMDQGIYIAIRVF